MFTGLVEALGTVTTHTPGVLGIRAADISRGVAPGDSVATNGICLTVTRLDGDRFFVDYSRTTREATTLGAWRVGDVLNLERALTLNSRLGGHLVSGHVDGVGTILRTQEAEGLHMSVAMPEALARYMVPRGSITVDGVSLTLVAVHAAHFELTIIPHTLSSTSLQFRRPGDRINLEVDILGKYVERLLGHRASPGMTFEELAKQGY